VQDLAQFMWDEDEVNSQLKKQMLRAFGRVRAEAKARKVTNRTAALSIGVQKVAREKARRGLYP
jgi:glutamate dehydrogenase (NAD(P)+)